MSDSGSYYIPHGSNWPIIASIGVCTSMVGGSILLNGNDRIGWKSLQYFTRDGFSICS